MTKVSDEVFAQDPNRTSYVRETFGESTLCRDFCHSTSVIVVELLAFHELKSAMTIYVACHTWALDIHGHNAIPWG